MQNVKTDTFSALFDEDVIILFPLKAPSNKFPMSHWGKTSALVANLAGGSLLSCSRSKEKVKPKEGSSDLSVDRLKIDVSNKNANKSYPSKSFFVLLHAVF